MDSETFEAIFKREGTDMTPIEPNVDDLRRALTGDSERTASSGDVDLVQRAVAGELNGDELKTLADRLHLDPALAEAWRAAVVVRDELDDRDQTERPMGGMRRHWPLVLGLAATVMAAVTIPSLLHWRGERVSIMREAAQNQIVSGLQDGAELPRDAFDLVWDARGDCGAFRLHVLDSDLEVLFEAPRLQDPGFRVPQAVLSGLDPGSNVLWWVETTTDSGLRIRSPTFVQRVQ